MSPEKDFREEVAALSQIQRYSQRLQSPPTSPNNIEKRPVAPVSATGIWENFPISDTHSIGVTHIANWYLIHILYS